MNEDINLEEHIGLAKKLAWEYAITSGVQFSELVGEAYLALVLAKEKFNPKTGNEFSTYAHTTIRNHLNKSMNEINEIRSFEVQPDYLREFEKYTIEESAETDSAKAKDTFFKNWQDWRDWSNVFEGIEKEIYNLVCIEGLYTKKEIRERLREMGYKFQEIWDAFASIQKQLKGTNG